MEYLYAGKWNKTVATYCLTSKSFQLMRYTAGMVSGKHAQKLDKIHIPWAY